MKADGNIDDLFRKALGEKDDGPPMHLWPGVAHRLPKPFLSPRRISRWASLAVGVCLLLQRDGRMENRSLMLKAHPAPAAQTTSPANIQSLHTTLSHQSAIDQNTPRQKDQRLGAGHPGNAPRRNASPVRMTLDRPPSATPTRVGQGQKVLLPEMPLAGQQQENPAVPAEAAGKKRADMDMPFVAKRNTPFSPMPLEDAVPPVKFLGERWFAGIDFSFSNDWMQRSLYAKNPGDEPYVLLRNSTEALRSANTASMRLSLVAASGITLRGGIQVARFNEMFSHSTEKQEIQYLPRRDAGGSIIGTDTVFQLVRTTNGQMNRFQTIDIPLTLGFEFPVGRANFGIHAGPVFNMAFYQRGKFLAEDGERIVDFSSSTPDAYPAFRNRLGMGFYGSVHISYPLTPSLHLFAEPYLRVFPGAVTNADYPLEQRYRTQGIFIGLRKMMGPYWMNLRP